MAQLAFGQEKKKKDPALELYFNANLLFNKKLYNLAAEEYEKFLDKYKEHPKKVDVEFGLSLAYYGDKRFKDAEPLLKKLAAAKDSPRALTVHLYLGNALRQLEREADAEGVFQDGLKLKGATKNVQLQKGLLECLYDQKKWKLVIPAADALAGQGGVVGIRASYQGAIARFETDDFKGAAGAFETLKPKVKGNKDYEQTTYYMLAEASRELNQFEKAADAYGVAAKLKTRPNITADAVYRLGRMKFDKLKNYKESAKAFGDFRRDFKGNKLAMDAGVYLGRAQLELGEFAKAENVFADLSKADNAPIDVPLWQARTFFKQKKHDDAVKVLSAAEKRHTKDPKLPELLFDLGNNHYELSNYPQASGAFKRLIENHGKFPQLDDALRLCADSQHREKKYQASHDLCMDFLSKYPNAKQAGDVSFLQSENLFLLEKYDGAVKGFTAFTGKYNSHPQVPAANYRIGSSHYNQKKWAEALKVLNPLAKDDAVRVKFKQLDFLTGDCNFRTETWAAAIKFFNQFVAANPKAGNADAALLMSGLASQAKKDNGTAIKTLNTLTADYPQSKHLPQAQVEIGRMQFLAGEFVDARTALEVVTSKHAKSKWLPDAEYYLGFVAREQDKQAEAVDHFALVADAHANHNFASDARFQQGMVFLQQDKFEAAQGAFEKLIVDHPQFVKLDQATYRLGWALEQRKKWDDALKEYSRIADFKDSDWIDNALYQSAWCEKGAGRAAKAMAVYKELLKDHSKSLLVNRASFELAELEFQSEAYKDAVVRLENLMSVAKEAELKSKATYRLAWSHFELEDFGKSAEAFEAFGAGLTSNPAADLKVLTGTAAYQAGEARMNLAEQAADAPAKAEAHKAAQSNFQKAVTAKNGGEVVQSQSLLRLGESHGLLEDWKSSQTTYEQFIQTYAKSGHKLLRNAWQGLGWAQENQKNHMAAVTSYQKVTEELRKDELGARAQFHIGECHLKLARTAEDKDAKKKAFEEAIKAYAYVEANYPEEVSTPKGAWQARSMLGMGTALKESGNSAAAQEIFRELVSKYPESNAATIAKDHIK